MREQPAQILEVLSGPTELFVEMLSEFRSTPLQHDFHCRAYGWHLYMQDSGKREAAMREEVRRLIALRRPAEPVDFQEAAE